MSTSAPKTLLSPDPHPTKPRYTPPPGACDGHCHIFWGTDFPHPNVKAMPDDGELVDLFAAMCPDEGLRRKILVENPDRLYWTEPSR